MSKIHILSVGLLALALMLTGCEAYSMKNGQVPGDMPVTKPGQAPGGPSMPAPHQPPVWPGNPDTQTRINTTPQPPHPPQPSRVAPPPVAGFPWPGGKGDTTGWQVYKDGAYNFQILYPPHLETRILEKAELAKFRPQAQAGMIFFNQGSSLGVITPPNFSIRIYEIGEGTSVEKWLEAHGLYLPDSGWTIEEYQSTHFSGYRVNSSLFMAPGWFIYATQGEYLYQLTPLGVEAETMLTTFEFMP